MTLAPGHTTLSKVFAGWVNPRLTYAASHQREFGAILESELHSTIVFLPIAALLLGAIFAFDRRYYLYDHAIFAMRSLSFMELLFSAVGVISIITGSASLTALFLAAASIHLFAHLRGVYSTDVIGLSPGCSFCWSARCWQWLFCSFWMSGWVYRVFPPRRVDAYGRSLRITLVSQTPRSAQCVTLGLS